MIKKENYCKKCKNFKDDKCTYDDGCVAEELYKSCINLCRTAGKNKARLKKTFNEIIDLCFAEKKEGTLSIVMQAFADYLKENKIVEVD